MMAQADHITLRSLHRSAMRRASRDFWLEYMNDRMFGAQCDIVPGDEVIVSQLTPMSDVEFENTGTYIEIDNAHVYIRTDGVNVGFPTCYVTCIRKATT